MDFSLISYFLPLHDNVFLTKLAETVTLLAQDTVIIIVGAVLYWCVDPKKGQRMAAIAIGGLFWTLGIKNFLKIPRPWNLGLLKKEQVIHIQSATGYSFPSGHTTAAVNIYGYFAKGAKTIAKILLWLLVALIGISRIFLGCHTSYDVLAALVISVLWIIFGCHLYDRLMPRNDANIFWFAIPTAFAALSLFTGLDADIIKMCSFGGVALLGIFLERKYVHYTVCGSVATRVVEFLIGFAIVAMLKFWPCLFGHAFYEQLWLKAINYAVIALWLSAVYPLILKKFNDKKYAKSL